MQKTQSEGTFLFCRIYRLEDEFAAFVPATVKRCWQENVLMIWFDMMAMKEPSCVLQNFYHKQTRLYVSITIIHLQQIKF